MKFFNFENFQVFLKNNYKTEMQIENRKLKYGSRFFYVFQSFAKIKTPVFAKTSTFAKISTGKNIAV